MPNTPNKPIIDEAPEEELLDDYDEHDEHERSLSIEDRAERRNREDIARNDALTERYQKQSEGLDESLEEELEVAHEVRGKVTKALNRPRKIQVEYRGGQDPIFLSLRDGKFYSYEQDGEKLHAKYGGRQYYASRTGLSGAGFLAPSPEKNDLLEFGYYRTDAQGEQNRVCVHRISDPENPYAQPKEIFGYVPIASHNGIQNHMPIVLTDGSTIVFTDKYNTIGHLQNWNGNREESKSYPIKYFDTHGNERELTFQVVGSRQFNHHLDFRRFLDLRDIQVCRENFDQPENGDYSLFESKLGIMKKDDKYYHLDNFNLIDGIWEDDPRDIEGPIANGWVGEGGGLFWRRRPDNTIEAFMEITVAEAIADAVDNEHYSGWVDFEEEGIQLVDWFTKSPDEWREYFKEKIVKKVRLEEMHHINADGALELLSNNTDGHFSIQDSLDAGNCEPGTRDFINRYKLTESCSVSALLEHPQLPDMLKNVDFRRVVVMKFYNK